MRRTLCEGMKTLTDFVQLDEIGAARSCRTCAGDKYDSVAGVNELFQFQEPFCLLKADIGVLNFRHRQGMYTPIECHALSDGLSYGKG